MKDMETGVADLCIYGAVLEEYVDTDLWVQQLLSGFQQPLTSGALLRLQPWHSLLHNIEKQLTIDIPRCNVDYDGELIVSAERLLQILQRNNTTHIEQIAACCTQACLADAVTSFQNQLWQYNCDLCLAELSDSRGRMWIHITTPSSHDAGGKHPLPEVFVFKRMRIVNVNLDSTAYIIQLRVVLSLDSDFVQYTFSLASAPFSHETNMLN